MNKFVVYLVVALLSGLSVFSQKLVITGNWKINFEDNKEFSQPAFDDSDWTELKELKWQDNLNTTTNRLFWIRKSIFIPSTLKKELEMTGVLSLSMGKIEQSDDTYLNGKRIGSTGSGASLRNYLVREDEILWDQENVIAIRVGHWGRFSMSIIPQFQAADPQYLFVYTDDLKDSDSKGVVINKDINYQLTIKNRSAKQVESIVEADFYNFEGKVVYSASKNVDLSTGEKSVVFPYKSSSPFVKVVYSISIPAYHYNGVWNGEYGYQNIVYQPASAVVPYKVDQNFQSTSVNNQTSEGWLGNKIEANIQKRLYNVDEKEILAGFINRPGSHSWIGEHIGKFLEAACNAYANSGDSALKIQIDRCAQHLIAAQLSDGYLGTYDMDSHWTSWDVWSHKYDMVGLLRYYELTGFKPALLSCEKIGDLLCEKFGSAAGQKDIIKSGAHVGMAATSVLDPMTDLYRFSGNKKYLDFCYYIIDSYDSTYGPRIISTLDSIGRVDKVANGKAYEMLSNLVGIIKLYRITNNEKFLKPVLIAWNDVVSNRMYITGTTSSFEHFHDDHELPAERKSNMGEGCVTTTWVQFNYQLFCIFGDIKYLDELERSVYNHLTGAENPQTGGVSYYTPLNGIKAYGSSITCCMSSIPRAIAMIPFFTNGFINHNPAFLLYQPGIYSVKLNNADSTKVIFNTVTNFPSEGKVSITVNPEKKENFSVLFRTPYWANNFSLKVNGKLQKTTSEREMVSIDRRWKKGDRIDISFDIAVDVLDGNISYPGKIAIKYGPQVLTFDQKLNNVDPIDVSISSKSIKLVDYQSVFSKGWVGTQAYQIDALVKGEKKKIILVPYADAGQTGGTITTWLTKEE